MRIEVRRIATPDAFMEIAGDFLVAREAAHQLSLGIVGTLRTRGTLPESAALLVAFDGGRVVSTAVWTAPWQVVLSEIDDEAAIDALVDALGDERLSGVHGPPEHAEAFAARWAERTGEVARRTTSQRSYVLEGVDPPVGVPGRLRHAKAADRDLLVSWMTAFDREAMGADGGRRDMTGLVDEMLERTVRTGYVWEDREPVSACASTGATPHGIRIGAVYTPPERRRRGYASALVAAASQAELDLRRRFCFLFTDTANPTSNHIYQAIGYRPVRDVDIYRFVRE